MSWAIPAPFTEGQRIATAESGSRSYVPSAHLGMGCLQMPPQMHRKCENSRTIGAREGSTSVVMLLCRVFESREPEHTTYRLDSVRRDSLSGNARQASLLAFLSRKLCRELDAQFRPSLWSR